MLIIKLTEGSFFNPLAAVVAASPNQPRMKQSADRCPVVSGTHLVSNSSLIASIQGSTPYVLNSRDDELSGSSRLTQDREGSTSKSVKWYLWHKILGTEPPVGSRTTLSQLCVFLVIALQRFALKYDVL